MSSVLCPPLRTPFTDIPGAIISHQWFGECAELEMKTIDCYEAYGLARGTKKCKDLFADFKECATRQKQNNRFYAMRAERERQYKAGERSAENRYAPPPRSETF